MKIAIIGAGVAGMTAAYSLAKNNYEIDIYEASSKIGGLSASIVLWNQKVDIGPHRFFSHDKRVNDLWLEVVGEEYEMVNRVTRIYYKNKFFKYPLKIGNTLINLGFFEATHCMISYFLEKINSAEKDGSFEAWVRSRFGKRLYEIFFQTYSEKLWGIPCKDLDADFAAQRIKKLSLLEAIKNGLFKGNGNKHKTLVDQFAYPKNGTGIVYEKMAAYVRNTGNNIYLNKAVHRVVTHEGSVTGIELEDGTYQAYDYVISTMPYTLLVKRLTEASEDIKKLSEKLLFRNTVLVYLLINATDLFPDNWIYINSSDLKMGRVTNFRNWVPDLYKEEQKTILAIEYWCNNDSEFWHLTDKDFISLASAEIVRAKLAEPQAIEEGFVYKIYKSYPVYSKGYKEILRPINEYLSTIPNLFAIGRYGAFKYNNQDHSILMGLLAAENILDNTGHQLHDINTDYDTYQESHIIAKQGFVNKK